MDHDMSKLETFLDKVMGDGIVVDGTVAQDNVQARNLFMLREDITVALVSRGYVYKYDVSLPLDVSLRPNVHLCLPLACNPID